MLVAVWTLGLLLIASWSLALWAAHAGWTMLAGLPWQSAADAVHRAEPPAWLEIWLGGAWREWLEAIAPTLAWLLRLVQGGAGWLDGVVTAGLWVLWILGTLLLLAGTIAGAAAVRWSRRRQVTAS